MSVRKQPNTDLRPIRWNHADEAAAHERDGTSGAALPARGRPDEGSVPALCRFLSYVASLSERARYKPKNRGN